MEKNSYLYTKDAYKVTSNKKVNSKYPDLLVTARDKLFWDIKVSKEGKYKFYIECSNSDNNNAFIMSGLWKRDGDITYTKHFDILKTGEYLNFTGELDFTEGNHHIFFELHTQLSKSLRVKRCLITGPEQVRVNKITNDEVMKKRRHAQACYFKGLYEDYKPMYYYREYEITKNVFQTYCTMAFSGGYIGLVPGKQFNFSVWHSKTNENKNKLINKNNNLVAREFTHEGTGIHTHYPWDIKENVKYGLILKLEYNKEKIEEDEIECTDYSAYFTEFDNKNVPSEWIYMGTIRSYGEHRYTGEMTKNGTKYNIIGGFLEQPGKSNGHLLTRSVKVGNDMASEDGINWRFADYMEYSCKDSNNSRCVPYPEDKRMEVSIGGKITQLDGITTGYLMKINHQPESIKKFTK